MRGSARGSVEVGGRGVGLEGGWIVDGRWEMGGKCLSIYLLDRMAIDASPPRRLGTFGCCSGRCEESQSSRIQHAKCVHREIRRR